MADWLEIVIPTPVAATDEVASALVEHVADAKAGVQVRSGEIVYWVELSAGEHALESARSAVAQLAEQGLPIDPARVRCQSAMPEQQWRDAWKKYFHTIRLTRQIVVVPSWDSHVAKADDIVIDLEPGQVFGTGGHATTHVLLEQLQELADEGASVQRVLDVGTGSGILAIAALKLWPSCRVVATDIDPEAVTTTLDNSRKNGVADRIECSTSPIGDVTGAFDLVLANIQAHVLDVHCKDICARAAPDGRVWLSGLRTGQARRIADVYREALGWPAAVRPSAKDPEWASVCLEGLRS